MIKRKICFVTGSRAEYGLLYQLIKEIDEDQDLKLQIIATGMHLSEDYGNTFKQIEEDGFTIDKKVDIALLSDTEMSISKSIGIGVEKISKSFNEMKPDLIVVLGDRYEIFSAAIAAGLASILFLPLRSHSETAPAAAYLLGVFAIMVRYCFTAALSMPATSYGSPAGDSRLPVIIR